MPKPKRVQVLLTSLLLIGLAWWALTRYSQPWAVGRSAEPVREFLKHALAGDSSTLYQYADSQPVRWVLAALRHDSAAVREWASNRGPVEAAWRGDTLRVTLERHRSTPRCSVSSFLTAAILQAGQRSKVVHMTASCPPVPETTGTGGT
jgi:hypothetical protein